MTNPDSIPEILKSRHSHPRHTEIRIYIWILATLSLIDLAFDTIYLSIQTGTTAASLICFGIIPLVIGFISVLGFFYVENKEYQWFQKNPICEILKFLTIYLFFSFCVMSSIEILKWALKSIFGLLVYPESEFLDTLNHNFNFISLLAVLVLGGSPMFYFYYIKRLNEKFNRPRHRIVSQGKKAKHRKILIMFVSQLNQNQANQTILNSLTGEIENDLRNLKKLKEENQTCAWEMNLRGIHHHIPKLERVYLFFSTKSKGNLIEFQRLIKRYENLLTNIKFLIVEADGERVRNFNLMGADNNEIQGWDFEDFTRLTTGIHTTTQQMLSDPNLKLKPEDIIIDFTSGQKVTSSAAIITTINYEISAQYVQTSGDNDCLEYDIVNKPPSLPTIE